MAKNPRLRSFLFFSILSAGLLHPITAHARQWYAAGAFLLSSCLLSYNKNKAAASPVTQKIASATNTDAHDLIDATTLSLYYWAWSCVLTKYKGFHYRYDATVQPLIQIAATTKLWNTLITKLPLGNRLQCPNTDCEGICNACEYKHLIKKAPLEILSSSAIKEPLNLYYYNKTREEILEQANDSRIKANQRIEAAIEQAATGHDECPICLNDNMALIPICSLNPHHDNHRTCANCYIQIRESQNPHCPLCGNTSVLINRPQICRVLPLKNEVLGMPPKGNDVALDESVGNILGEIGVKEPLWVLWRKNNMFPYRLAMALYRMNPLIARHTTCNNSACTSICNQCKLKKLYTPLYIFDIKSLKNWYETGQYLYERRDGITRQQAYRLMNRMLNRATGIA